MTAKTATAPDALLSREDRDTIFFALRARMDRAAIRAAEPDATLEDVDVAVAESRRCERLSRIFLAVPGAVRWV
jgi:hypothetical protein